MAIHLIDRVENDARDRYDLSRVVIHPSVLVMLCGFRTSNAAEGVSTHSYDYGMAPTCEACILLDFSSERERVYREIVPAEPSPIVDEAFTAFLDFSYGKK